MNCCVVGGTKTGGFENAEGRKRSASLKRQMETTGKMNQYDRDRLACCLITVWPYIKSDSVFLNTNKSAVY